MPVDIAIAPFCPRQDHPPLLTKADLFDKTWWLYFNRLRDFVATPGPPGPPGISPFITVLDFGAVADGQIVEDGAINSGSHTFTSASANFSEDDLGKAIWIAGAGPAGTSYTQSRTQTATTDRDLLTIISHINSSTSVQVVTASSATVSGVEARYGTDNTTAIQDAMDSSLLDGGFRLYFPRGKYLTTDSLSLRSHVALWGEAYTYESWKSVAPTMVMCCADVPVLQSLGETEADGWNGGNVFYLTLRGTSRPGSAGIYSAYSLGTAIQYCSFSFFGDQAIFLNTFGQFGIHVSDCSATDSCLVDDRTDYIGVFEFGPSDLFIARLESAGIGLFNVDGLFGSGYIAAIKVTGNNSFVSDCIAAGAQIGYHVGATAPVVQLTTTLVNCRADQNQGHGFVVSGNSWSCHFLGCRSHNNGLSATDLYDGFLILQGTHQFTGCQVTKTPVDDTPFANLYRDAFRFDIGSDAYEPSKCNLCFVGNAYVGESPGVADPIFSEAAYFVVAPTRTPIVLRTELNQASNQFEFTSGMPFNAKTDPIWFTARAGATDSTQWSIDTGVPGLDNAFSIIAWSDDRATFVFPFAIVRNQTTGAIDYISFRDASFVIFDSSLAFVEFDPLALFKAGLTFEQATAAVDEKRWHIGPGAGTTTGTGEFQIVAENDAVSASTIALSILRTGIVIDSIRFTAGIVYLDSDVKIHNGGVLHFDTTTAKILADSGSPEGVVAAVGGSLYLDGVGKVWGKVSGTGNTGWAELVTSATVLAPPFVDTTSIVKGSSDSTKQMRIEVDGLTTGTTRVMTMPDEDIVLAKNSVLEDNTGGISLTTSYADTGMAVTLDKDGTWLIVANMSASMNVAAALLTAKLVVNGVDQAGVMNLDLNTATGTDSIQSTMSRSWTYSNSGSNVAKIQGKVSSTSGGGGGSITGTDSNLVAIFLYP